MPSQDVFGRLVNVAGAAVGAVGLVYVVGAISLSMRYDGLGLPGNQAAALTPREMLLAAGLRTLAVWAALGAGAAFLLSRRDGLPARRILAFVRTRLGVALVVVAVVALVLFVHVLWPLAALLSGLAAAWAIGSPMAPLRRVLVIVAAVAVTAVAYEADRISYLVEWTCVDARDPASRPCGVLVGQQDRGFYLGVPDRLLFVPSSRVGGATSQKRLASVTDAKGSDRREAPLSRVVGLDVR